MTAETMVWNVNFETQEQADKFNSFNKLLSEDTSTLEALDNASSLEEFFNVCKNISIVHLKNFINFTIAFQTKCLIFMKKHLVLEN